VVGVVNKIEDGTTAAQQETPDTFAEFKQQFRAIKAYEKAVFSSYRNQDGSPCDPSSQCTTAAVFNQMDRISFDLVYKSIESGLKSILTKVNATKDQLKADCAPPLAFYDRGVTEDSEVDEEEAGDEGEMAVDKSGREVLLREMRSTLKRLAATELKKVQLYHRHLYDEMQIATSQEAFLREKKIHWPEEHTPGDMFVSQRQQEAVDAIRRALYKFIDRKVAPTVAEVIEDDARGCFSPVHSRFHRIDRFPRLVTALQNELLGAFPACIAASRQAVVDYLQHFWDYQVPKGVSKAEILALLEQLKHVAVRKFFEQLRERSKGDAYDALVLNDELLVEEEAFVAHRDALRARWEHLHRQEAILNTCLHVTSNEMLRATLEQAYMEQQNVQHTSEEEWMAFWVEAEREPATSTARVNPPSTNMFAGAHSPELTRSMSQQFWGSQMDVPGTGSSSGSVHEDANSSSQRSAGAPAGPVAMAVEPIYHPSEATRTHGQSLSTSNHRYDSLHSLKFVDALV
jgi:hypothetical protein